MSVREVLLAPYLWRKAGKDHHAAYIEFKRTSDPEEQRRIYYDVMCPLLDQTWRYILPAFLMIVVYLILLGIPILLAAGWLTFR